jgi:FkbM family methyltransferase
MLIPFKDIVRKYGKPKGILHVGANIGEEAEAYNAHGVENVIWVEANESLMPILKENVFKYKGHKVLNACIGDIEGEEVMFHISNNAGQSSSYLELGTHKIQHPEVHYTEHVPMKTIRIDSIRQKFDDFDWVSLDIQGAELKALRGMGDLLRQFRFVYSEVNRKEVYKGCALLPDMDSYLHKFGFKRVETAKWIGDWSDALWVKK